MLTGTIWPGARDGTEPAAHGLDSWPAGKTGLPGEWRGEVLFKGICLWELEALGGLGAEDGGHDTYRQMEYMKLLRFPL